MSGEYTDCGGPARHSPSGWTGLTELSKQRARNLGVMNSSLLLLGLMLFSQLRLPSALPKWE